MKKTILLAGALLICTTHFYAESKKVLCHSEIIGKHQNMEKDAPKKLFTNPPSIPIIFDPIAIINFGNIESQLPTTSKNGITGKWYLVKVTPIGPNQWDYYYKFLNLPSGQTSQYYETHFTVYASNSIQAVSGSATNVLNNIIINGVRPTADMVEFGGDGASCIDPATGNITCYGSRINYRVSVKGCPDNYAEAWFTHNAPPPNPETGRMAPQQETNKELTIYPNPSKDIFNIDLRGIDEEYDKVKVFSITGALIYEGELIPRSSNTIDLSSVRAGFYFAQISNSINSKSLTIIKE